jgi:CheY-like chemotaxis protein
LDEEPELVGLLRIDVTETVLRVEEAVTVASGQLRAGGLEPAPALLCEAQQPVVMLVEDDRAIGCMYSVGLEVLGFQVLLLSDVNAVFLQVDKDIPDVVVLDFDLGGIITGVDVLENLRLDRRTAHLPAFILSNHLGDLDGQIDRAFAAGAVAWLVKSKTSPADLGGRISEALASI